MIAITPNDMEWYTPGYILDRVYNVMPIDLDPCSPKIPTVKCNTYYSLEDDGLSHDWFGNVFMNPPYGREIKTWVSKFISEWESDHIQNAILLVPVKSDTAWWRNLVTRSWCWCGINGRVTFISPSGSSSNVGTFASALILFTRSNTTGREFILSMRDIGLIWKQFESEQHV